MSKKIKVSYVVCIDDVWFQTPALKFNSMEEAEEGTKHMCPPDKLSRLPVGSKVINNG